ncbi:hypothetical protein [Laribacter hongkongensis]|uniref:hypothetical protein n=1 Tax=Laribacter hongkongensis TaxID=168471 RepID=UPI001EFC94BF|nr:hypothetical protein [Laribacter hongkongensis]MCG9095186.1 hypothetical protein [Laribacter hongkongensis]
MKSYSDFLPLCHDALHEYGFDRDVVSKLLNEEGISAFSITAQPTPANACEEATHHEQWDIGMRLRKQFTINEAACIICNTHPDEMEQYWREPWPRNISSMRQAIIDNWHQLDETFDGNMDNVQGCTKVNHKDIARWCYSMGIHWPLMSKEHAMRTENTAGTADKSLAINSATFAKLRDAISAFPHKYPQYRSEPPKLDADVRKWLGTSFGCGDREKHVFGQIIREHFCLNN